MRGRTAMPTLLAVCVAAGAVALSAPAGVDEPLPPPQSAPVLLYHVVGEAPADAPNPELYVAPPSFAAEIHWLSQHGYAAVTLDRLFSAWHGHGTLPRKPVVITFDDGYPEDVSVARPLLDARGWVGVLFLQVGNLDPEHVRQLAAAGWEIDAHTFTHPDLTDVDAERLRHEVGGSRAWIRGVFHVPCDFFAYPSGRHDDAVVAAVRAAGFAGAVTTDPGRSRAGENPYTLRRIRVLADESLGQFARSVRR